MEIECKCKQFIVCADLIIFLVDWQSDKKGGRCYIV